MFPSLHAFFHSTLRYAGSRKPVQAGSPPHSAFGVLLGGTLALLTGLQAPVLAERPLVPAQALADYVGQADASFRWEVRQTVAHGTSQVAELNLTSQTWRGVAWRHRLYILRPESAHASKHALLLIAGGSWNADKDLPPQPGEKLPGEVELLAQAAHAMQTPICVLTLVPFQPMFGDLHEDEIISHTFMEYHNTGDPSWPALLPMVKSAVKGMDAVKEYCQQTWQQPIETFTVTGASKRGWTTWLTAAVDPRVTALAPMVIDVLNMKSQMRHQLDSFGGYSEEINDYSQKGLPELMSSPAGEELRQIVDPFSYRDSLKQPKLIILGTNDRYWPVDALNLYFEELVGPKYILYCPNQGHGIKDYGRVLGGITALQRTANGQQPLPQLAWEYETQPEGLKLSLSTDVQPTSVRVWQAHSATRDFRDARWISRELTATQGAGEFEFAHAWPAEGFSACFGEFQFNRLSASKSGASKSGAESDVGGNSEATFPAFFSTTLRVCSAETKSVVIPLEQEPVAAGSAR